MSLNIEVNIYAHDGGETERHCIELEMPSALGKDDLANGRIAEQELRTYLRTFKKRRAESKA